MTNLSSIVEVKHLKGDDNRFVSFETMVEGGGKAVGPTPLELAQSELQRVQDETAQLVADAKAEVEKIKKDAYDAGFAKGEEEGLRAGKTAFDEKIAAISQQIIVLAGEQERIQKENEAELLTLIRAMVAKLVNHEVSVNHKVIEKCLARAMTYVVGQSRVVVHLNPEDFLIIKDVVMEDPLFLEGAGRVELMEDLAVKQGGCLLVTEFGEIDATLENRQAKLDQAVEQAFLAALSEVG
jgi:flagellar assembly protein FliH